MTMSTPLGRCAIRTAIALECEVREDARFETSLHALGTVQAMMHVEDHWPWRRRDARRPGDERKQVRRKAAAR